VLCPYWITLDRSSACRPSLPPFSNVFEFIEVPNKYTYYGNMKVVFIRDKETKHKVRFVCTDPWIQGSIYVDRRCMNAGKSEIVMECACELMHFNVSE